MTKTIYNYDAQTGEFVSNSTADESPLEPDVFLIPAFATDLEPTKVDAREVSIFTGGKWEIMPDWRGVPLFSISDGTAVVITDVGQTPADVGATDMPQPSPQYSWQAGVWVMDDAKVAAQLGVAKAAGLSRISDYAKSKRALIAGTSDDAEIAGWNNKLRIAQAIGVGNASDGEITAFQAEITSRGISGETLDIFCQKVTKNAVFFAQAVGLIDGLKRRAQDAVSAADSPEAVEAVLTQMHELAETAYAELMQAK